MRVAAVVAMALSLGLVAGCSEGAGADAKGGGGTQKAGEAAPAASKGPVYAGAPVPGLAKQQAWSLPGGGGMTCAGEASKTEQSAQGICALGDAVVVTKDSGGDGYTAQLLDAKSGEERKKFDIKTSMDSSGRVKHGASRLVQVGEWRDGSPALLIRTLVETPAKDLKKASSQTVLTMYAPSGKELGSSTFDGDSRMESPVVAGYVVDGSGAGEAKFLPIGGGEALNPGISAMALDKKVGPGLGYSTDSAISYQPYARWLVVTDNSSGKRAWGTKDLAPPAAIAKLVTPQSATTARLASLHGDKAVLEWSAYGETQAVLTSIELKTGRRIAEGPAVDANITTDDDGHALSPDGKTAVVQYGKGAVAWNPETGQEIWRQAKDELNIYPRALPGNGVLYASLDNGKAAALDARTKQLLPGEIEELPEFTTNGYAILQSSEGFFVFATQPV
ncbi:PQQ-like beta-propeller repeat protein [Streptomyces sp. NBC_01351]|uniref:PQQ-binding-like beta-propeller repeat protein n=1 Tax=Streptomyces sp. NBC_01351 TaxID=2903833 RepID=UPI002E2FDCD0|nr:PQQ-binding-like beta-propeller repeat protein [Streptomyces sp. NBC_01351]